MTTRLSKIARLPAPIREEINHRLQNGELSRTVIPWVNELPETKKIMADLYRGNPITHQNLSEWRHTGYQDWLFHQQRLEWNGRLAEEESEVTKENRCEDGYEAMGFQFLYEIAQALKAMQKIKNPNHRWERLETLTREFCRLQNAFNWSRRVALEFDKFKLVHHSSNSIALEELSAAVPPAPQPPAPASAFCILPSTFPEKLPDAPRNPEATEPRASIPDCGSPLPLSAENSPTPESPSANSDLPSPISDLPSAISELPTSSVPTPFQPLPTLAPPTPSTNSQYLSPNSRPPTPNPYLRTSAVRGRRFVCIEG